MTLLDILLAALAVGILAYAAVVPKHRKMALAVFAGALALLGIDTLQRALKRRRDKAADAALTRAADARRDRGAARAAHEKANDDEWETVKAARKDADTIVPRGDPDAVADRFNRKPPGGPT